MEFTKAEGWLLIAVYAVLAYTVTFLFSKRSRTKSDFLVADRKVSAWPAGFSIAATWIWAPALFLAAEKAYTQGWPGVFWFTVPNVATLVIFGYFAVRLRRKHPEGFTLSGYMRNRYSNRVQNLYMMELGGLAACSFAVQLLAGGAVVTTLTGIPFLQVTVSLALIAVGYSLFSGIRASVVTDVLQMTFMAVGVLIFAPWALASAGWSTFTAGLSGSTGTFGSLFSGDGGEVAITFGIAVTIGLLSGPFGDQSFYQRAFSVKQRQVKSAFLRSSLIFATVPLAMSVFGFLAAGAALNVEDTQLTNVAAVIEFLPAFVLIPFMFILLSGLVSTLDSNLAAISSLAGHDGIMRWLKPKRDEEPHQEQARILRISRTAMLLLAVAAVGIANIPGMKILYLFLFYGALRSSTLMPTIISLVRPKVSEPGMFYGIAVALVGFVPLFAYGNWNGILWAKLTGIIGIIVSSGLIVWFTSSRDTDARPEVDHVEMDRAEALV